MHDIWNFSCRLRFRSHSFSVPHAIRCCFQIAQMHDTPNYSTCSNFWFLLLRIYAFFGVYVTTLQSFLILFFYLARFRFHCSMLFSLIFCCLVLLSVVVCVSFFCVCLYRNFSLHCFGTLSSTKRFPVAVFRLLFYEIFIVYVNKQFTHLLGIRFASHCITYCFSNWIWCELMFQVLVIRSNRFLSNGNALDLFSSSFFWLNLRQCLT